MAQSSDPNPPTGTEYREFEYEEEVDRQVRMVTRQYPVENIRDIAHMYISRSMGWVPVQSECGMKSIVDALNLHAPVHYATAARPIATNILRQFWPSRAHVDTVTMGKIRYKWKTYRSETGVMWAAFEPACEPGDDVSAKTTRCVSPVPLPFALSRVLLPYRIESSRHLGPVRWIRDVFGANYTTVLWLIGDIMSDQGQRRLWILYGPGGVGKSTVVSLIVRLLGSGVYTIAPQKLILTGRGTSWTEHLQQTDMLGMASCRVVVANNVDVDDNINSQRLNAQSIKCITGGRVQCNILACMNTLVANTSPGTYARPENLRRIVVVPTVNERTTTDRTSTPTSEDDVKELLAASVATRLYYERPPMEINALIATIFQGLHHDVWTFIRQDNHVSLQDAVYTNAMLCARYGMSMSALSASLRYMGGDHIFMYNGCRFIGNIVVISGRSIRRNTEQADARSTGS